MECQHSPEWAAYSERWQAVIRVLECPDLLQRLTGFERWRATLRLPRSLARMLRPVTSDRRRLVLQVIQPGLAGLMDGSVSTLAPVFAAACATYHSREAFLIGMAASIGAGISMGFSEALSDDGVLSERGRPWRRGLLCGVMTTLGGVGHTLPFLLHSFNQAVALAVAVVVAELALIAWIRHRYMDTRLLAATFQVVAGGMLVFLIGILIGSV